MMNRRWPEDILPSTSCSNVAGWNPQYVQLCGAFRPIWYSKVLVWHHCHHVFENSWIRQSKPLLFFLVFTTSRF